MKKLSLLINFYVVIHCIFVVSNNTQKILGHKIFTIYSIIPDGHNF